MLSRVLSASTLGVDARLVEVEIHLGGGLPRYFLVGLPDRAVSESRDRIEAALKNIGAFFPRGRITVNLAPANLPKEGSSFDLPIALALLSASGQVRSDRLDRTLAVGELALDGKLRPVKGILPIASEAKKQGVRHLVVPEANGTEAAVIGDLPVYAFRDLPEVTEWLKREDPGDPVRVNVEKIFQTRTQERALDFCDVRGQESVKRALEVAAAGSHNLILVGPPGSGKTMMARRLPTILPMLSLEEAIETTRIHSVAGILPAGRALVTERPFRSPHHTITRASLSGGGVKPQPGEISMAHNGVLFLDELPEFNRSVLEVLRQPLEDGVINVSRIRWQITYPGNIMLVAAMNPSPVGEWYDDSDPEKAPPARMLRYLEKISGPLLDRIDLHIEVDRLQYDELASQAGGESSESIRGRVTEARKRQKKRFQGESIHSNAQMNSAMTRKVCVLDKESRQVLKKSMSVLGFSARAFDRILKVSRTIADLEDSATIQIHHLSEAIQYRSLDRSGWLMNRNS